mgnify:CR=1 FL=1
MHVFSCYYLLKIFCIALGTLVDDATSHALWVQCRPVIDIHIILFAGNKMDSYFVEAMIASIVRRIWRLRLWFWTGWVCLQHRLNIWYKLGLTINFTNLTWQVLATVYSTQTKYLDKCILVAIWTFNMNSVTFCVWHYPDLGNWYHKLVVILIISWLWSV